MPQKCIFVHTWKKFIFTHLKSKWAGNSIPIGKERAWPLLSCGFATFSETSVLYYVILRKGIKNIKGP